MVRFFIFIRLKRTSFEVLAVMRFILWFRRHDAIQTYIRVYKEFEILKIEQVYFYVLRAGCDPSTGLRYFINVRILSHFIFIHNY
jgi:hypothetical protein